MNQNETSIGSAFLDDIEFFESKFENLSRLSYWNPEKENIDSLLDNIIKPTADNVIEYIFSYDISPEIKRKVLEKFGLSNFNSGVDMILNPSGTASIYSVINLLKEKKINYIGVLAPVYFSFPRVCENLQVDYKNYYLQHEFSSFTLSPKDKIEILEADAIWITNPVYCTSVFYDEIKSDIKKWIDLGKIIIFDESLCLYGFELIREFDYHENIISIVSPHKSLCINGMKFSGIITSKDNAIVLNEWLDIIVGCLSVSNMEAVNHFLSDNFNFVSDLFIEEIVVPSNLKVIEVCKKYNVIYDKNAMGGFITLYFPDIPLDYFENIDRLKTVMLKTNCSFIPGSKNHFESQQGFCFRINLARVNEKMLIDLEQLILFLKSSIKEIF